MRLPVLDNGIMIICKVGVIDGALLSKYNFFQKLLGQ